MQYMRSIILASACVIAASGSVKAMDEMEIDTVPQSFGGTQTFTQPQQQDGVFGAPQTQGYGPQIGTVQREYIPLDGYLEALNKVYEMEKYGSSDIGSLKTALFTLESKISKFCDPTDGNVKKILHYIRSFKSNAGRHHMTSYDKEDGSPFIDGVDEPIVFERASPQQFLATGSFYHQ